MAYLHLNDGRSSLLEITTKLAIAILLISGIPDIIFGAWETLWYLIPGIPICVVSYLLNRQGKRIVAGNIFAVGCSVLIFLMGFTSAKNTNIYLYYIPFVIGLPFLINYSDKKQLLVHVIHISFFWLILVFYDHSSFVFLTLQADHIRIIGQLNVVLSVFFCQFFVLMIIYTNRKAENAMVSSKEKLRVQNETLAKGNRELDKFVYSISHDLRSPVASILGLTSLAGQAENLSEMQEYTQLMERSLLRLESYIQDILDYSRNTRLTVAQEPIDFTRTIEEVVGQCRLLDQPQAVEVQVQVKSTANGNFYTDPYRLQIILNKIIANAFYYQKPNRIDKKIRISADISEYQAVIRVIDNGIGIAAEDIERIFTMFYRSNVTKPGSGLGLYIAREAANRIGGRIAGSSTDETEFIISLPNLGKPSSTLPSLNAK